MKELTHEQAETVANANAAARAHLTNAITELQLMMTEIAKINPKEGPYFSPFDNDGKLNLLKLEPADLCRYIRTTDQMSWKMLISRLGIYPLLAEEDYIRINRDIENHYFGALTVENIMANITKLKREEETGFRHLVQECFRYFSPNYQKREPIKKKNVQQSGSYGRLACSGLYQQKWEILGKVLLHLDHKELPENFNDFMHNQMDNAVCQGKDEYVCPYFKAKFYPKSQTVHLDFERMDLVEKINEIGRNA